MLLLLSCNGTEITPEVRFVSGDFATPRDECSGACVELTLSSEGKALANKKVEVTVSPAGPKELALDLTTDDTGLLKLCLPPGSLPVGNPTLTLTLNKGLSDSYTVDFPLDIRVFGFKEGRERTDGSPETLAPPFLTLPEAPFLKNKQGTWFAYQISTASYAQGLLAFSGSPRWEGGDGHNPYHIGIATVDENWEISSISEETVLTPVEWDANAQHDPFLIWDGSRYIMYYQGRETSTSDPQIGRAFSSDGLEWEADPNNPVFANIEEKGASHASFIRHDENLMEIWFAGLGGLGYAFSVDDGASWENYCANPILPKQEDGGVKTPEVTWDGEKYTMTFAIGEAEVWRIGWAESYDGIRWNRGEDILEPGTHGWDNEDLSNASRIEGPSGPSYLIATVGTDNSALVIAPEGR
jgi:hypothetical protein